MLLSIAGKKPAKEAGAKKPAVKPQRKSADCRDVHLACATSAISLSLPFEEQSFASRHF
jgi:hypothetical protein